MRIIRYNPTLPRYARLAARNFAQSPWARLESEIDRLFSSTQADAQKPTPFPVDLYEDKDNATVRAELPGINRDDIQIELVDGSLTIKATRRTGEGDEATATDYTRVITVPDTVQIDQVTASSENGVLTVTLPKRAETKPRKITIAVK